MVGTHNWQVWVKHVKYYNMMKSPILSPIVPVVQSAAHANSSTLYGLTVVLPNFFGLMGYYYFVQLWGYAASSAYKYNPLLA